MKKEKSSSKSEIKSVLREIEIGQKIKYIKRGGEVVILERIE